MAAVDYINSHYKNWQNESRDQPGAGLVAFLLGITSHYITDINWHGLEVIPAGEGLIRTMGYVDFNCVNGDLCSVAHSAADTGGEFTATASMNVSWYPAKKWYIPVDDLVNIYIIMNSTGQGPLVKANWIKECGVIFYVGSWATAKFGDLIYPLLASSVGTLLLEEYNSFPVGGVGDDAAWTSFMWNRLAGWLAYGTPETPPVNLNSNQNIKEVVERPESQILRKKWLQKIRQILLENNIITELLHEQKIGITIELPNEISSKLENAFYEIIDSLLNDYILPIIQSPNYNGEKLNNNEWLEKSTEVKQLMYNRLKQLLQSNNNNHNNTNTNTINSILMSIENIKKEDYIGFGQDEHEFYGSSITVINNNEILIGSPGAGRIGGPQEGRAELILNNGNKIIFQGGHGSGINNQFPSYERFGWSSASCDINNDKLLDIIICAPSFGGGRDVEAAKGNYTGRCDIFYGPFHTMDINTTIITKLPDVSIYGDKIWGNFGYTLTIGDLDNDGLNDLIISAPYAGSYPNISYNNKEDLSSQGAVYIFFASSFLKTIASGNKNYDVTIADIILQQPSEYQWFGKSLNVIIPTIENKLTTTILLIGAPTFHSENINEINSAVGRIYGYIYSMNNKNMKNIFTITGDLHAGRTGQIIKSFNNYLAISEPAFNTTKEHIQKENIEKNILSWVNSVGSIKNGEILRAGRVIVISISELMTYINNMNQNLIDIRINELNKKLITYKEFYGNSFDGRFGSNLLFHNNQLIISEPLAEYGAGAIHIYDLNNNKKLYTNRGSSLFGLHSKGRFGQSLNIISNKLTNQLLVSAPYLTFNKLNNINEENGIVTNFLLL